MMCNARSAIFQIKYQLLFIVFTIQYNIKPFIQHFLPETLSLLKLIPHPLSNYLLPTY